MKKKKRKNHSGFMYANPKKVDKIEWEFCFFLTWDLLYADFTLNILPVANSSSHVKFRVQHFVCARHGTYVFQTEIYTDYPEGANPLWARSVRLVVREVHSGYYSRSRLLD